MRARAHITKGKGYNKVGQRVEKHSMVFSLSQEEGWHLFKDSNPAGWSGQPRAKWSGRSGYLKAFHKCPSFVFAYLHQHVTTLHGNFLINCLSLHCAVSYWTPQYKITECVRMWHCSHAAAWAGQASPRSPASFNADELSLLGELLNCSISRVTGHSQFLPHRTAVRIQWDNLCKGLGILPSIC